MLGQDPVGAQPSETLNRSFLRPHKNLRYFFAAELFTRAKNAGKNFQREDGGIGCGWTLRMGFGNRRRHRNVFYFSRRNALDFVRRATAAIAAVSNLRPLSEVAQHKRAVTVFSEAAGV